MQLIKKHSIEKIENTILESKKMIKEVAAFVKI